MDPTSTAIHVNAPMHTKICSAQNTTYAQEASSKRKMTMHSGESSGSKKPRDDGVDDSFEEYTHGASLDYSLLLRWAYHLCTKKVAALNTWSFHMTQEQEIQTEADVLKRLSASILSNDKDATLSSLQALK
ncbi:hypothetical protein O0I10_011307 [Lichtheimia ornata]|uniref:Uncharacterized protein n=1 Tax=Lichtheimia ornata TaxID=688661 RepID=A0AAD7UT76_9FUNG|nr:uncharacterized protein O0I10_011307 [Lichtheimia ornata]KAJ8653007.1 hypothetical protein O0I10_011307 [Lichtheimia ornata]